MRDARVGFARQRRRLPADRHGRLAARRDKPVRVRNLRAALRRLRLLAADGIGVAGGVRRWLFHRDAEACSLLAAICRAQGVDHLPAAGEPRRGLF